MIRRIELFFFRRAKRRAIKKVRRELDRVLLSDAFEPHVRTLIIAGALNKIRELEVEIVEAE